ncbi:O-antigen ligase [uncultured Phenylobacterium sp.]|uniref:O-antigen ligase family protein n=1 Tax=uncultured Phenylobacterium sp. TaxID=349273 RepID=UPI0025CD3A09|nr:O-antigen ligase family protein [uncultured Phenylobacterium sp.]
MSSLGVQGLDRLGVWCGWVLVAAAGLTPLLAWLGPLGFAALLALVGLLCLPAVRVRREDGPLAIVLLALVAWAALSSFWSPSRPNELEDIVVLKLAFQLILYWAAWQGARRADPALRRLALRIFAWGLAAYGVLLLVEAATGAAVYQTLRSAVGDPIRPDLARKNVAHGAFVLALLWPVAAAAGWRAGAPWWLAAPMAVGSAVVAQVFLSDAPVLAVGVAVGVGLLVWTWPRTAPKALAAAAVVLMMLTPVALLAAMGRFPNLPLSWSERMAYWSYAVERIAEHPLRGWGLDASRTFGPAIGLHPHNGALQVWLELGVLGASLLALAWAIGLRRLAGDQRCLVSAAAAGSAAVYLFFGAVSFGVWQEWWLALGALVCTITALGHAEAQATSGSSPSTRRPNPSKTPGPPKPAVSAS